MVIFNLLPWREHVRAYQHQALKAFVVASSMFSFLFITLVHVYIAQAERHLQAQVSFLKNEVKLFQPQDAAKAGQEVAVTVEPEQLACISLASPHLILALGNLSNPAVCLNEIDRGPHSILLSGFARSAYDLAYFLKTWKGIVLFQAHHIQHVRKHKNGNMQFSLQLFEKQGQQEQAS